MKKLLLIILIGAATLSSGHCRPGGWFVDIFTSNNCGYYNQPVCYQPVVTYYQQSAPVYYQQPCYYYQQPAPVYYQQPYYGGSSIQFGTYNNGNCNNYYRRNH